ncbi:hypothetical protein Patl1_30241 [Pistacia atlantica]|uniref:Uncharacterized protein n=1 Tax=Pistacia atlantica TaxID=434234 RepID=A0ACC1AA16_9ROSI|nr:hypothetical protein Patl1_30241 [Pistacia atlantica]
MPREFEVKDILKTIAKQLTVEFEEVKRGWTEEELMKRINCFLRNKRAVAVLADQGLKSIHDMRALSNEESWDLFKRKVFVPEELQQFG